MALKQWHWLVIVGIFTLDRLSKWLVETHLTRPIELLPFLRFALVKNAGVAFGFLNTTVARWPLVVLACAVIIFLVIYSRRQSDSLALFSIALIIAGAAGNGFDRIFFGTVVDFVSIWIWPAFNVADAALTMGVLGLLWSDVRSQRSRSHIQHKKKTHKK